MAGLATLVFIMNACSSNAYLSQVASTDFRIDGQRSEWTGRFQIPKGEKFALGVSHDKNYLYVAVSSIDRGLQRQLALNGLTIWLDAKGRKRQNLGFKFEGMISGGQRPDRYQRGQYQDAGSRGRDSRFNLSKMFKGDLTLIMLDAKAGKSLGPADLLATANSQDETLFIEYQIPLALLGEDFDMNKKLGLGLESISDRPAMAGGRAGGMSGGGMGGKSGGMNGGQRGGGHQPGSPSRSGMGQNDLEVWMKIQLIQ